MWLNCVIDWRACNAPATASRLKDSHAPTQTPAQLRHMKGVHAMPSHHPRCAGGPGGLLRSRSFYINCIRQPDLTSQNRTGRCTSLHVESTCEYKNALPEWRAADSITVDARRCTHYLPLPPPPRGRGGWGNLRRGALVRSGDQGQAGGAAAGEEVPVVLAPVTLALRPYSTDHDVFLQVRLRARPSRCCVALYCGWDARALTRYLRGLEAGLTRLGGLRMSLLATSLRSFSCSRGTALMRIHRGSQCSAHPGAQTVQTRASHSGLRSRESTPPQL